MKKEIVLCTLAGIICSAPAFSKVPVDVSLPAKAKLGQAVTVAVKTDAKAKCKIEAQDAGFTQMLKLTDQTADGKGKAKWKFNIPKDYKADEMPVIITVSKDKDEEKVTRSIKLR